MNSIAKDREKLDKYARAFWNLPKRGLYNTPSGFVKQTYFASLGTVNWIGFIERINECIQEPSWIQINQFVEFYCKKQEKDPTPYLELYHNLEELGYSPVFKTDSMHAFYLEKIARDEMHDTFYREIYSYFNLFHNENS